MTKRCEHKLENGERCDNYNAQWNFKGLKPKFCTNHADKKNGMIDVKNKKCIGFNNEKCNLRPSYGFHGQTALYCKECGKKTSNLIVPIYKLHCSHTGCKHIPVFNFPNEKKGKFCFKHKELDMINVKGKRCPFEGCDSINPPYDFPSGTGTFCHKHYEKGMINIRTDKCIECNILTASYGKPFGKPTHCNSHKLNDMINVKKNRCDDCDVESLYGLPSQPASKCFQHREKGMVKRSNSKCSICNINSATFGFNFTVFRCENCKLDSDENLSERKCKSCNLLMILNKNEICEFCDPDIFQKYILIKQNSLQNVLESYNIKIDSIDKTIDNGMCGKERPDFVFDMVSFILILECDEHQHKDRLKSCETTRMINIGQSYGGIPVYFIRWNPDTYKPGNKIKKPESINKRHTILCDFIKAIQNGTYTLPSDSLVSAIYMYYDGWTNLDDAKWQSIHKFEN